ncbi:MAG TPA: 3-hydroxyacyl-CoA dehydrogenase NAD-binding domain-containing protein [Vicinamibacterales bacterium]|nr:3-hydroxyacyl-CoA dehydrogenase NAD-binding domain-containing protein [Vicinamibacterales bacterium]
MYPINRVAVLGAGVMGAQIAAHLANAGIPVHLLDLTDTHAKEGLKRAFALSPNPLFTRDAAALISTGGFDSDLQSIGSADWVVEAIVEQIDAKRALLEHVDAVRRPGSIASSNTSGIPIAALAEGRSGDFRRHWMGTHFFNPPRYLHLLEIIPTPDTDTTAVSAMSAFADRVLGKGVVIAKDSPGFIANHIGLYGVVFALSALSSGGYTIEEIDAITGPALGRPKSATFRTMDIAGIDVLAHVTEDLSRRLPDADARRAFVPPPLVRQLVERKLIGEKTKAGFYKREGQDILTLDPATLTYRARQSPRLGALDAAQSIADVGERTRALFLGNDKVGAFLRATLGPLLIYSAKVTPAIAQSIDDVDRAMRWGFGWEIGPFEIWDAIGVREVLDATGTTEAPELVRDVVASGRNTFRAAPLPPPAPDLQILRAAKAREKVVRRNAGASLVDLGDGVLAVEFHSKMNAIGADTVQMIQAGIKEAATNFSALVIGNDAPDFSAGANLMLLLLEAQEGNWDEIDMMIRGFQQATVAIQRAPIPVVVAPAGRALGGGCEIALRADRVQAAAETYIGLVEAGVGLIPGGGGTAEMLARATARAANPRADLLPLVQPVFEAIGFAKVSTSAAEARQIGYLRACDGITMNPDRLMADAKAVALERVREGYRAPAPRSGVLVGGEGVLAALKLGIHLAWRAGRISDYDAFIGRTLAFILAGGALPNQTTVSEDYLLDLEREAFLKLCGEPKTLERIQYTLKTGKPLRN